MNGMGQGNSSEGKVGAEAAGWYCARTQNKHEHIAAAELQQDAAVEVFLPRVRFRRRTRTGPQWVTEALFPSYLFVRFELSTSLRRVQHARGVTGIVHFGEGWPTIPEEVIAELKRVVGEESVRVLAEDFRPGEEVKVMTGAFAGLEAVVTRHLPSRQRVAVLLEFLGRQTLVELAEETVVRPGEPRGRLVPVAGGRGADCD